MRKIICLLICCIMLCGCAGVSQKDYDSVCQERDELKKENKNAGRLLELNKKASEYKAKIEAEYEHALFVFYVSESVANIDISEQKRNVLELKETSINALNTIIDTYGAIDSLTETSDDIYNATIQTMETINEEWGKTYDIVMNVEKMFMGE